MKRHFSLLITAVDNLVLNWTVYVVGCLGLFCGLLILFCASCIREGLQRVSSASIALGPDIFCTFDTFGRDSALPNALVDQLRNLPLAQRVVPRIIGRLEVGDQFVTVVGLNLAEVPHEQQQILGQWPQHSGEILVGAELAQHLKVHPGDTLLLEAYRNRIFRVAGLTASSSSLWGAKAIVCDLEESRALFDEKDHVSDVCLYVREGSEQLAAESIRRVNKRIRVQTKTLVKTYVREGFSEREGVVSIIFLGVVVLAVNSFGLLAYLGFGPRRVEFALMKAEGWQSMDVLEMVFLECLLLNVLMGTLVVLCGYVWIKHLDGAIIATFLLADMPYFPASHIPFEIHRNSIFELMGFSSVATVFGHVPAAWRACQVAPARIL